AVGRYRHAIGRGSDGNGGQLGVAGGVDDRNSAAAGVCGVGASAIGRDGYALGVGPDGHGMDRVPLIGTNDRNRVGAGVGDIQGLGKRRTGQPHRNDGAEKHASYAPGDWRNIHDEPSPLCKKRWFLAIWGKSTLRCLWQRLRSGYDHDVLPRPVTQAMPQNAKPPSGSAAPTQLDEGPAPPPPLPISTTTPKWSAAQAPRLPAIMPGPSRAKTRARLRSHARHAFVVNPPGRP